MNDNNEVYKPADFPNETPARPAETVQPAEAAPAAEAEPSGRYESFQFSNETPAQPVEAAPVAENPWSDAGYVPSADAAAVPRNYHCETEKKEKRAKRVRERRRGMPAAAVVAVCLVCAIIGGLAGSYLPGLLPGRAAAPEEPAEAAAPEDGVPAFSPDGKGDADKPASTAAQTIRRSPSPAAGTLSPSEIYYDLAVSQVVGITSSVTYNYYGRTRQSEVSGSGFIVSGDGYILTNCHVIENAAENGGEITVLLYDGSEYPAEVIGYDEDNDVGVLKIDAADLLPASIGDSDALQVGETVYVVGNAMGYLEWSMTSGLVSGVDREISAYDSVSGKSSTLLHTFQTEATINSGNSGGPVYNDRGEVVGIAVASYSSSLSAESLNFAIPINTAIDIANDLIDDGVVSGKPYIGILGPDTLSATYAQYYGIVPGVYFQALEAGGPAEKAGMQVGDIIVGLGDHEIASNDDLDAAKRDFHAGDTTTIRVYRGGEYLDLTITLGDMNDATGTASGENEAEQPRQDEPPRRQQPDVYDYYDYFSEFFDRLDPFG